MREILFKAKRLDNGGWVEGFPFFYKTGHLGVAKCEIMTEIHPVENNDWFDVTDLYCPRVDPNTLCQFTGLTDKNGNKIWENDIVKFNWNKKEIIDVIEYSGTMFSPSQSCRWSLYKDEVIGNIFDNPDLIKEEN